MQRARGMHACEKNDTRRQGSADGDGRGGKGRRWMHGEGGKGRRWQSTAAGAKWEDGRKGRRWRAPVVVPRRMQTGRSRRPRPRPRRRTEHKGGGRWRQRVATHDMGGAVYHRLHVGSGMQHGSAWSRHVLSARPSCEACFSSGLFAKVARPCHRRIRFRRRALRDLSTAHSQFNSAGLTPRTP